MKKILILFTVLNITLSFAQQNDSIVYKKRVLDNTEVDFLLSYYKQDGVHSAVSGGMGSEDLTDVASNIVVSMPLNDDDILTIDAGISAYTSASSSNINPYDKANTNPWQASSGASQSDQLTSLVANYSHSSDDRNLVWNADLSFSNEYDYTSIGFGGGIAKLFNNKNTELSLKANVYLDQWRPIYPKELIDYADNRFSYNVLDENGNATSAYNPSMFSTLDKVNRNSYSASFGFSQVATKNMQFSLFFDIIQQQGLLSTPYHRVYFADKADYYVGQAQYIPVYETTQNQGVYKLADDIERLPDSRSKIPVGARLNYYLNERVTIRTYYRYYWDNWDITSHTISIELPIKISDKFTIFPMYRYYTQQQSKYFAGFEKHLSTEKYYTSDYDLSTFAANQYGFGVNYVDIFTNFQIWKLGLKNIDFRFNHYTRSDGLKANIASIGFKFVM
jgi:hypothetical protein